MVDDFFVCFNFKTSSRLKDGKNDHLCSLGKTKLITLNHIVKDLLNDCLFYQKKTIYNWIPGSHYQSDFQYGIN